MSGEEHSIGPLRERAGSGGNAVEEVIQDAVAVFGQHRLGMKLDTMNGVRAMTNAHDDPLVARPRDHLQFRWQAVVQWQLLSDKKSLLTASSRPAIESVASATDKRRPSDRGVRE